MFYYVSLLNKIFFLRSVCVSLSGFAVLLLSTINASANTGSDSPHSNIWTAILNSLQSAQQNFDAEITKLITAFQHDSQAGWWLIGISFLYGVLHAAGPGHGKAIISSYLVANNDTLKNGIILAFLSSLLQAATAVILVGLLLVGLTFIGLSLAVFADKQMQYAVTRSLEIIGSILIILLGLRLLFRKSMVLLKRDHEHTLGNAAASSGQKKHGGRSKNTHGNHNHSDHIISPVILKTLDWKQVLPLIFSIGIRPCTGALVVMTFAMINHAFLLGVFAVLAMAAGTFLVVSLLAYIAVNAKELALKLSSNQAGKQTIRHILEWLAALFIVISGLILLIAALY